MPIIVIKLNTDNPQDVEILRLINNRLLGLEEAVLRDYDDFWARTSKRTREVLKLWSESPNQEPRTIIELGQDLQIEKSRVHAAVGNLGKWGKRTALPLLESTNRRYQLSIDLRCFLLNADVDASCSSWSAKVTDQLHSLKSGFPSR